MLFLANYNYSFNRDVQIYLAGNYRQCNTVLFTFQAVRVNTRLEKSKYYTMQTCKFLASMIHLLFPLLST